MTDKPIDLDRHRGTTAQAATEGRRHLAEVEADQETLRHNKDDLERVLFAGPAANWQEAAAKVRYLLVLFAASYEGRETRYARLVADTLNDIDRLLAAPSRNVEPTSYTAPPMK